VRVNIYAEEMTDQVEITSKIVDGHTFTGVRFYLHLPVTLIANKDQAPITEETVAAFRKSLGMVAVPRAQEDARDGATEAPTLANEAIARLQEQCRYFEQRVNELVVCRDEASFDDLILNKLGKIMSAIDDLQNAEAANAAAIQAVLADLQSQTALLATLTAELASTNSRAAAIPQRSKRSSLICKPTPQS
jgi:hypothetical protein